jgi:transcriptional antiterminator RfaH
VPAGVVETMVALADAEGLLQLHSNLKVGAPVRFAAGPFAEQLGVIDRLDNAGRIRVLLNILGRQVPVRLNRNYALPAA